MTLGEELKFFTKVATPEDIEIMLDEDISAADYERLGFIFYSLGLESLQQDFFRRNALKFQGVIDWEAELNKSDIERYASWLREFVNNIESPEEGKRVSKLFGLDE